MIRRYCCASEGLLEVVSVATTTVLRIEQLHGFAPLRQVAVVVALHEKSLVARRPGRALAEGIHVRRNVERSAGGNHDAVLESQFDAACELPAGNIDGDARGIDQREILLVLVARGRRDFVAFRN